MTNIQPLVYVPPANYILVFLCLLSMWLYRWLFAPPESRRLLMFATLVSAFVMVAVLNLESASWIRLTLVSLWAVAVGVLLALHRNPKWRGDSVQLLAAVGIFTVALITVVYGVNSHAAPNSRRFLGYLVLWLAILAVVLIGCLTPRRPTSRPNLEESEQQRNTKN